MFTSRLAKKIARDELDDGLGPPGERRRYQNLVAWAFIWRLIVLAQIPAMLIFCPERLGSSRQAGVTILLLALAWAGAHFYFGGRFGPRGASLLPLADLAACGILLLGAGQLKLVFIVSFYSQSSLMLLAYRFSLAGAIPGTLAISCAYIGGNLAAGLPLLKSFTQPNELGTFILYWFVGLGLAGFANIIRRVSSLELDVALADQRRSYRRYLHDHLGNMLAGMHLKLQSLSNKEVGSVTGDLGVLARNYRHVGDVLQKLLTNLEESQFDGLAQSLEQLKAKVAGQTGVTVKLDLMARPLNLGREIGSEVYSLIRESVYNAVKHSGAREVFVALKKKRNMLVVDIKDKGCGFTPDAGGNSGQGKGLAGMRERAAKIGARLSIATARGSGCQVTLRLKLPRRLGPFSKVLDYHEAGGGLYPFLLKIRLFMLIFMLVQWQMLTPADKFSPAAVFIIIFLSVNCFILLLFRRPLYSMFASAPWLLLLEQFAFAAVFFLAVYDAVPVFFSLYMGVGLIITGFFAGIRGNTMAGLFLAGGIAASYLVAPHLAGRHLEAQNLEDMFTFMTGFIVITVSGGLAGDFTLNLESLQLKAVGRALAAQKDRLNRQALGRLKPMVANMITSIEKIAAGGTGLLDTTYLEAASASLKKSLREIITSLDEDQQVSFVVPRAMITPAFGSARNINDAPELRSS